jgi:hypothetical protein
VSDGLREALTKDCVHRWVTALDGMNESLGYTHCGLCGVRRPETDGGAAAPGGIDHPVSAGPASEATSTAAPSSPDHTHGGADHGTRYLVVEIPPAASEADADAITDLVANHVYAYEPVGENKAWDPFIHGWTWPEEVPHPVAPRCVMTHTPPMDFAQCETHDETFPLGQECRFKGREAWEVFAEEADEQRQRAVRAEMALEASPPSAVCPYCGMSTWVDGACALPGCEGHARPVLWRDAVAEVLREAFDSIERGRLAGLPAQRAIADAIVALARSEQEVREQIAEAIEAHLRQMGHLIGRSRYHEAGQRVGLRRAACIARGER